MGSVSSGLEAVKRGQRLKKFSAGSGVWLRVNARAFIAHAIAGCALPRRGDEGEIYDAPSGERAAELLEGGHQLAERGLLRARAVLDPRPRAQELLAPARLRAV